MASQISHLTENEREWFDYFMDVYSKDEIVVKLIHKIRHIAYLEGQYDGILYD